MYRISAAIQVVICEENEWLIDFQEKGSASRIGFHVGNRLEVTLCHHEGVV